MTPNDTVSYLVGTIETIGNHFGDNRHQILRFLYHIVHLGEGGRLAHRDVLYRKL